MSTEKRAVGMLNGWRCPDCKHLVKGPKDPAGPVLGGCKVCGANLIFEKTSTEAKNPYERIYNLGESSSDLRASTEMPGGNLAEWIVINFEDRPMFLRVLERLSKDRKLTLSEVVIGFAARGYKDWIKCEHLRREQLKK